MKPSRTPFFVVAMALLLLGCGGGGSGGGNGGASGSGGNSSGHLSTAVVYANKFTTDMYAVLWVDVDGFATLQLTGVNGVEYYGTARQVNNILELDMPGIRTGSIGTTTHAIATPLTNGYELELTGGVESSTGVGTFSGAHLDGHFPGHFYGADEGDLDLTISKSGAITGTLTSETYPGTFSVVGNLSFSGVITFSYQSPAGKVFFAGYVSIPTNDHDFHMQGTWRNGDVAGTFGGSHTFNL